MSDLSKQLAGFLEAVFMNRKVTVGDVIHLVSALIVLEQKIEKAIETEKDAARRRRLADAFKRRDLDAVRDALFVRKPK